MPVPSVSTNPVPEPVPEAGPSVSSGSSEDKSENSDENLAPKVASESIKSDPHIPPFMDIARPSPFRQGGDGWSIAPENPRWSNGVQPQDDSSVTPKHQALKNRRSARLKAGTGAGGARHAATLAQTPRELVRAGVTLGITFNKGSELCNHPDSECLDVPIGIPQEEVNLKKTPQSKQQGKTQKFEHFGGFINNFNFLKVNFGKTRPIGRTSLPRI